MSILNHQGEASPGRVRSNFLMAKISMSVAQPTNVMGAVKFVRQVTGLSLSSALTCLQKGRVGIFYKAELFLNDHLDKDREIRELVQGFKILGLELFIMEILFDEDWAGVRDSEKYRIDEDVLMNILDEARARYQLM